MGIPNQLKILSPQVDILHWRHPLVLRKLCEQDAIPLAQALADTCPLDGLGFLGLGDPSVGAHAWLKWRLREESRGETVHFAGFDATGTLVGEAALANCRDKLGCADLSYWVRLSARRQGIGRLLARAMCNFGFSSLNLSRVETLIHPRNIGSIAIACALGAKPSKNLTTSLAQTTPLDDEQCYVITPLRFLSTSSQ